MGSHPLLPLFFSMTGINKRKKRLPDLKTLPNMSIRCHSRLDSRRSYKSTPGASPLVRFPGKRQSTWLLGQMPLCPTIAHVVSGMVQLTVDIGGRPGINCRGFCEYCYFKHVKETRPFGCVHCPPYQVGCDYCSRSVREYYRGWKTLR